MKTKKKLWKNEQKFLKTSVFHVKYDKMKKNDSHVYYDMTVHHNRDGPPAAHKQSKMLIVEDVHSIRKKAHSCVIDSE